jgi:cytochrome c-type biogenesis protein CcmH
MKRQLLLTIYLILITAVSLVTSVSAQEVDPGTISDNEVNAIAKQLYCPVCENIPLDVCGTQACAQWRELIREKLADGWSEDEIKNYFVAQYGDRVLAEPPRRGLNWLVYIVPPVAFLAGVFILYRGIQSWRQMADSTEEAVESDEATLDDYVARMEEALRRSDK